MSHWLYFLKTKVKRWPYLSIAVAIKSWDKSSSKSSDVSMILIKIFLGAVNKACDMAEHAKWTLDVRGELDCGWCNSPVKKQVC